MDKRQKPIRKAFDISIILLFLCFIFLPLLSKIIPIEPRIRLQEKRILAGRPQIGFSLPELLRFPGEFDRFYKDNFGFRSGLVFHFNRIRSRITGLTIGNDVLVGKDNWYFVKQNRTLDDFRGIIRLSPSQLDKIKSTLEDRRDWLAMFGIKYLLAIAPAKWEIYPEKVPDNLDRVSSQSVLDQILAVLQDRIDIDVLDLREPLRELKNSYSVYYRVDTHWNSIGLFAAVQEIKKELSRWFPEVTPDSLENYDIGEEQDYAGDLARMMGLQRTVPRINLTPIGKNGEPFPPRIPPLVNPIGQTLICDESALRPQGPGAVIFHDSFGRSFHLYMKDSFRRSVYSFRSYPDTGLVLREHPDVVIQELGQRNIAETLSQNPAGIAGPKSTLVGKTAKFLCPATHRLTGFRAQASLDLAVRQHLSLHCDGKKIAEWPVSKEEMWYTVPEHDCPPDQNLLTYSFAYRYEPSRTTDFGGKSAFPFDLRVICRDNRSFVGINGGVLRWSKGYNIYVIGPEGRLLRNRTFDAAGPDRQSSKMAPFIRKARSQKGYLLLVSPHGSGRGLTRYDEQALRSLGLRRYPGNQPEWNYIALVDLGANRVIAERSGKSLQMLAVRNYRTRAGFEIRSLQVTGDSQIAR